MTTAYYYKRELHALCRYFPTLAPDDFSLMHLETFTLQRGSGKAASTRKKTIVAIRQFFDWLVDMEVTPSSPARMLVTPTISPPQPRFLTAEQVHALFRCAHIKQDLPMLVFLALGSYAGCRHGDIQALLWKDVDFTTNSITLRHTKGDKHNTVPMAPYLRDTLHVWQKATTTNDCGYVFAHSWKGIWKPYYYATSQKKFRNLAHKAGLPLWVGPHDLRRTFATTLHQSGVDMHIISRLLGHASIDTTMKHYAFTSDAQKSQAVNTLAY